MEPQDPTHDLLLEDVLDTTEFVHSKVHNLARAVVESFAPESVIYFVEWVEDAKNENEYYGYIFNKTENKIYEFFFVDHKVFQKTELTLTHKEKDTLTTKNILGLHVLDQL